MYVHICSKVFDVGDPVVGSRRMQELDRQSLLQHQHIERVDWPYDDEKVKCLGGQGGQLGKLGSVGQPTFIRPLPVASQ